MSRSQPFFTANLPKAKSFQPVSETEFKKLHWTKQLELRPLNPNNDTTRPAYERGDFDTRLDCWDDNEYNERTTT